MSRAPSHSNLLHRPCCWASSPCLVGKAPFQPVVECTWSFRFDDVPTGERFTCLAGTFYIVRGVKQRAFSAWTCCRQQPRGWKRASQARWPGCHLFVDVVPGSFFGGAVCLTHSPVSGGSSFQESEGQADRTRDESGIGVLQAPAAARRPGVRNSEGWRPQGTATF